MLPVARIFAPVPAGRKHPEARRIQKYLSAACKFPRLVRAYIGERHGNVSLEAEAMAAPFNI
jgi:hypothetical protein